MARSARCDWIFECKNESYLKILLSVNRLKFKANKQMSYLNRITLAFWKLESFLKASRILKDK